VPLVCLRSETRLTVSLKDEEIPKSATFRHPPGAHHKVVRLEVTVGDEGFEMSVF
jgi:hypothetical protein